MARGQTWSGGSKNANRRKSRTIDGNHSQNNVRMGNRTAVPRCPSIHALFLVLLCVPLGSVLAFQCFSCIVFPEVCFMFNVNRFTLSLVIFISRSIVSVACFVLCSFYQPFVSLCFLDSPAKHYLPSNEASEYPFCLSVFLRRGGVWDGLKVFGRQVAR